MNKKTITAVLIAAGFLLITAAGAVLGLNYLDIQPQSFQTREGTLTVAFDGTLIPVLNRLEADFEEQDDFLDLFASRGSPRFTQFTLQSPAAPTVGEYVALRRCIFKGDCEFVDNRIDLSDQVVHRGEQSLRFYAVPPQGNYVSKSSLDTTLLKIGNGDRLWFSGYFYAAEGMPRTLADFETSAMKWGPGPRLILLGDLTGDPHLGLELKHGLKPTYRQEGDPTPFPRDRWVHVLLRVELSSQADGLIQIWQDCQLIVSARGKTLPKAAAVLDRMQLGITAAQLETTLYVDDVLLAVNPDSTQYETFCP